MAVKRLHVEQPEIFFYVKCLLEEKVSSAKCLHDDPKDTSHVEKPEKILPVICLHSGPKITCWTVRTSLVCEMPMIQRLQVILNNQKKSLL